MGCELYRWEDWQLRGVDGREKFVDWGKRKYLNRPGD